MKSLLLQLTSVSQIIDFLIENKGMDFSKKDMAQGAGISRATLFNHWKNIENFGIVKETRRFGKTKLYTLNSKSKIVKKILELEKTLISEIMDEKIKIVVKNKSS